MTLQAFWRVRAARAPSRAFPTHPVAHEVAYAQMIWRYFSTRYSILRRGALHNLGVPPKKGGRRFIQPGNLLISVLNKPTPANAY